MRKRTTVAVTALFALLLTAGPAAARTPNGQRGYEGQPGHHGGGHRGHHGQPGNHGNGPAGYEGQPGHQAGGGHHP